MGSGAFEVWVGRVVSALRRTRNLAVGQLVGLVDHRDGDLLELVTVLASVVGAEQELAARLELHAQVGLGSASVAAVRCVAAAARYGTVVSYDLNFRPSLWKGIGGVERAREVNRRLAKYVDVMIGNEEDFDSMFSA